MHPWFGIRFAERKRRRDEFKQWLKDHPLIRLHAGATRDDGAIFIGYGVGYADGEQWADRDTFNRRLKYAREKLRRLRKTPEFRAAFNDYIKNRYANKDMRLRKSFIRSKAHQKEKPWMNAAKSRRRYALKRSMLHQQNDPQKERALFIEAAVLTKSTGQQHHVDHIIPLKHGGWHHHDNLQVLPDQINYEKSFNPFWHHADYMTWREVPRYLWPEKLFAQYQSLILRSA